MELTIAQGELTRALRRVVRAMPARAYTAVGGTVYFDASTERVTIHAGDDNLRITTDVPAAAVVPGQAAVPGRRLTEYVAALPPEPVRLTVTGHERVLRIRCGRCEAEVATIATDEYRVPMIAEGGATIVIAGGPLGDAIARVAFAAAGDAERPVLSTVLWERDADGLTLAAADGFRLARARMPVVSGPTGRWLMPARAVTELGRILSERDISADIVRLEVAADERAVQVSAGPVRLWARLLAGAYPNLDGGIPSAWGTRVRVDLVQLCQVIAAVRVFGGDGPVCAARLDATHHRLRLTARNGDGGEAAGELDAEVTGEPGSISLNLRLLTDILGVMRDPVAELSWTSARAPVVLRDGALPGPDDLWLAMPLHDAVRAASEAHAA